MRKRVILIGLSLLFLFVFILTFVIAEGDPVEDALNGTGYATEINRSGWNLTGRGKDFDLYLTNETVNSTYYMEISPESINYFNGTEFEPINTTIVSSGCDYDYCVRKGVYFADFRDDYNPSGMIRFYYNGSEVIYTPISLTYYNGSTEQLIANASVNVTGYVNVSLQANSGANLVHSFVGVACPGAFEGESFLINRVNEHPNSVARLQSKQILHPNRDNVTRELLFLGNIFVRAGDRISLNLWSHYNDAILLNNDSQPGNFNINKSKIFYGYGGLNGIGNEQDDGMVTVQDNLAIADNINSSNSDDREGYGTPHQSITDERFIKQKIMVFLLNDN